MTFVILTGGIDLSVGSILALATSLVAMFLTRAWSGMSAAILVACGRIGSRRGHEWRGDRDTADSAVHRHAGHHDRHSRPGQVAHRQCQHRYRLRARRGGRVRGHLPAEGGGDRLICAVRRGLLADASRTVFGRYVRAIGDNELASKYAGLPLAWTKVWVYLMSGLLSGFAGVLYAAENHQGNPNAGVAYELDAIAAVVIGGTRLSGGKGSIAGTIVGTLIMGVLTNMLRLKNVDSNVEMMIKAVIIVLAVAAQRETKCGLNEASIPRGGGAAALLACRICGGNPEKKQFFVAFSQANNAEPYRAAQNALMTKLFAQDARREAGDLRRAAGQQQAGGAGGDLHPAEAGPADRGAQRKGGAHRRDGPGDGGAYSGDLPGARYPAAQLHHVRAQR